ncbi:MAG: hypothetical protein AAGI03_08215 [Pseudomonadota bacterium]
MGNGNRIEMMIAVCAVISSLAAVFIAWDQGRVMRAQQHGSVYPVIQVDGYTATLPGSRAFGLRIYNNGVGPALIENLTISFDGSPVSGLEAGVEALPPDSDISWTALTGRALAPGDELDPIRIVWFDNSVSEDDFLSAASYWARYDLRVCYCSVFNRCWETRGVGTSRADRVESCLQSEGDVFEALGHFTTSGAQPNPQQETPPTETAEPSAG